MNISDRIVAAEAELTSLKDALIESTKALEAAPDEQALLIQVEELAAKTEKQSATVGALKKAETALAARAKPVDGSPAVIPSIKKDGKGNGDLMWKMATAKILAHVNRKSEQEVVESHYKGNEQLSAALDFVQKSAVNPAMTSTTGWAVELMQTDYQGFLNTLRTNSVAAELMSRSMQLNFGGYNSITIPVRNALAASLSEPAWVGEAGAIPLSSFQFSSQIINRFKLAAITTMSREVADRSTPSIEALVRDGLSEAYGQVLDMALLSDGGAITNIKPAGLLNGLTPATGTSGGGEAAVIADIKRAIQSLASARLGQRTVLLINTASRLSLGLIMNPLGQMAFADELAGGRLLGLEVISSMNVPANTAIVMDAATFATAFDTPIFDVSDMATVVEANAYTAAPTMANGGAAGAVGTAGQVPKNGGIAVVGTAGNAATGYTARSLWQTYSLGIRMVAPTSWALLRGNSAVHVTQNITW